MGSPGGVSGGESITNAGDAREPGSLGWEDPPKNAWVTEHSTKIDALSHDTVLLSLVLFSRKER